MTKHEKEAQASPESVSAYQLKKLGESILQRLDQIEAGETRDASLNIIHQKFLDLSVKLNPVGEDILKALAHHLMQVERNNKATIEFMRSLVCELFELYQVEKIPYVLKDHREYEEKGDRPDFIAQRMKQASFVHDPKKLTREHPSRMDKKECKP